MSRSIRRRAAVTSSAYIAGTLVIAEMVFGALFGLPLLYLALCAIPLTGIILWAISRPRQHSDSAGHFVLVAVLLKILAVSVSLTGGLSSPYLGILFLPIFLGALYFGLIGGAATGLISCLLFIGIFAQKSHSLSPIPIPTMLTQCGVTLLVSTGAGSFAERLRGTASTWSRRARRNADQVRQIEWYIDTAVMMQSLPSLDDMLSAALLRLGELIPNCAAVIYLRAPDATDMALAQTKGIDREAIRLRHIPESDQASLRSTSFSSFFAPHTLPQDRILGVFANVDSEARSVIVVPLRTIDDLFGVLYVSSRESGRLKEADQTRLVQFALHMVYPIQRSRLQALATTDALTGLHNNRAFRRRLKDEAERSARYHHPLSVILFDIDHFKRVNDRHGHPAGDAILKQIGVILQNAIRGIDLPARYGGEEMAIICPETVASAAAQLADRIRVTVAETKFELPDGSSIRVTVSGGVAEMMGDTDRDMDIVARADAALYLAKSAGRDCVRNASETHR